MRVYVVISLMILCLAAQKSWAGEVIAYENSKTANKFLYPPLKLIQGKQFALCRDIYSVLKEPENKDIFRSNKDYIFSTTLSFSKKYKKFKHISWHSFAKEEILKYFKKIPESLLEYEKDHVPFNLFWGKADLDRNGDADLLVRLIVDKRATGEPFHFSELYVSDIAEPDLAEAAGGMSIFREHKSATPVYYEGVVYIISNNTSLNVEEYTAPRSDQPSVIIYRHLCSFLPIAN